MSKLLLKMDQIKMSFGMKTVLDIAHIEVHDGDRIGLVGENGAGKSTLLKLMSGEREPDEGRIQRMCDVGVIHQMDEDENLDAFDAQMQAEFHAQEMRNGLSGGERTRRRIAGALSMR
ncbi:ATP-binding cassette domain-containing protein, partial [Eubacteriales bacterium OttesenSCG-928-N13]|nr:ATP-binding cassette domain-containing protein [Eubacteriales bacterium OttesenSCG-928-N13]